MVYEPTQMVIIKTNTGEVFFIDRGDYWNQIYLMERPELLPVTSTGITNDVDFNRFYYGYDIGPGVTKAYYSRKNKCFLFGYDFTEGSEFNFPNNNNKYFNVFKFNNDEYYVEDKYLSEFKKKEEFIFISRSLVLHDMFYFSKISDGVYKQNKYEYFVFSDSTYIYLVNVDFLSSWEEYKNKIIPNIVIVLEDIITIQKKYKFLPYYSDDELIRISYGIFKVRNIVPDKVYKKYSPWPMRKIEPLVVDNKEDYQVTNCEFYCFKNLDGNEYLVNTISFDSWIKLSENKLQHKSSAFLYKKYLYRIQPYEYKYLQKGIYIKIKPITPHHDNKNR